MANCHAALKALRERVLQQPVYHRGARATSATGCGAQAAMRHSSLDLTMAWGPSEVFLAQAKLLHSLAKRTLLNPRPLGGPSDAATRGTQQP